MGILATKSSASGPQVEGSHIARCVKIVQIGKYSQWNDYFKKTVEENKVVITWELPNFLHTFKEEEGPRPVLVRAEYTLSLGDKSALLPVINSWGGKPLTNEERNAFDVSRLLGAPCVLSVNQVTGKNGNLYPKVIGVSAPIKGMEIPAAINTPVLLAYDNFDMSLFEKEPDFIKDRMMMSDEFKKLFPNYKSTSATQTPVATTQPQFIPQKPAGGSGLVAPAPYIPAQNQPLPLPTEDDLPF